MIENETPQRHIYCLVNFNTGERLMVATFDPQRAADACHWDIGLCFILEVKAERHRIHGDTYLPLVKVQCNVCAFQYASCLMPTGQDCPCRPETPDLQEWLSQVVKAHLCNYVGPEMAHTDYLLHQKWLPFDDAVKELTPR